ncbi:hypothetical protein Ahy_A02g005094 isoform A [Arachis hypogaea]|uniref:Uncharacterized protein n=1 Tax=Arachis hypogaea TaxID=3818 RepID=A0A445E5P9_ARAHY|nr:hypothetical protein Ahy_A02g005094 isoform A [Arachis hypogaea]
MHERVSLLANLILFPRIPKDETLEQSPTPTIVINYVFYLIRIFQYACFCSLFYYLEKVSHRFRTNLILFPRILDEETLEELPTSTIIHSLSVACFGLLFYYLENVRPTYNSGIFRCFFLSLRQSEPPVHIQETIIIAGTIRHLTLNHNDPIAIAKLYQLSYIFSRGKWSMLERVSLLSFFLAQQGHPRLELETSANLILFPRIPDKKTLEEPPTPTIVHVRYLLDLTNYLSYIFYVIENPSLSE